MAVSVNVSSAKITFNNKQASPALDVSSEKRVIANLGNNYTDIDNVGLAFSATADVVVSMGAGDTLNNWQFGFIQFQRINRLEFYYAGKTTDEGAISLFPARPPAMSQTVTLDSKDNQSPWTEPQPRYSASGAKVFASTGDHPLLRLGGKIPNKVTSKDNYLFHMIDDREFWSVFTAQDPDGKRTYMMHFQWSLRYEFMLKWKSGKPAVDKNRGTFQMGDGKAGAPAEPALANLLANPVPPHSNLTMAKALVNAIEGGKAANRTDLERRYGNVPPTFWT